MCCDADKRCKVSATPVAVVNPFCCTCMPSFGTTKTDNRVIQQAKAPGARATSTVTQSRGQFMKLAEVVGQKWGHRSET